MCELKRSAPSQMLSSEIVWRGASISKQLRAVARKGAMLSGKGGPGSVRSGSPRAPWQTGLGLRVFESDVEAAVMMEGLRKIHPGMAKLDEQHLQEIKGF